MENIKRFNEIIVEGIFDKKLKGKKVELVIVEMKTEDIVATLMVDEQTASDIAQSLYLDRKKGGKYSSYIDPRYVSPNE